MGGKLRAKALPHQYKFIASKYKFTLLLGGYGSGKTESLIYKCLKFITDVPKARIAWYEPTVDLIKQIVHPRLEEIFANSGIKYKLNKSENIMQVFMPTGKAEIVFRSCDNFARIIGYEVSLSLVDEIDTLPKEKAKEVWVRIIARNRKKFYYTDGTRGKNQVAVATTPEGFGFTYEMWGTGDHQNNPDYFLIRAKSRDNYHLPPDYIPSLEASYPPQLIDAYLNGEWVNLNGATVYQTFDRTSSNTHLTLDDFPKSTPLHIGMDFNVGRMAAVVACLNSDPKQIFIVDEVHHAMDTPEMIMIIKKKYPSRTITIYPDASGRSRKAVDASKSDIRLLRDAGFRVSAPKKNPPVRERVVTVNTLFLNAKGERSLFVNISRCPNLTEQLEKQVYDDNSVPVKDGQEDPLDALGYLCNRIGGLARPQQAVAKMRFGA